MKSFLLKSVIFFACVAFIFKLLDVIAVSGLSKLEDDDYKDLLLLNDNKIEDDMLILGSSRAWNHFDIKEIEKVTNIKSRVIGLSGADFNMQRALWEQALNSENSIKYIVHVVGALEFSKRKDGIFKKYKFFPFLENDFFYSNLSRLQGDLWKDKYLPLYKFHGSYKYFMKGVISNFRTHTSNSYKKYKGFRAFESSWNGEIKIDSRVISNEDRMNAISFIREEAHLAIDKNKVLIIVYAPEHVKTNDIIKGKNEVIKSIEELAANFESVYFLDYHDWYGNTDLKLFHNATHLNAKGAKLFSETFSKDVLKIIN